MGEESVLTSPEGVTWTSRGSGTSFGLSAITYGDGQFVAVGDATFGVWLGRLWTSPDGVTWTERTSAIDLTGQLTSVAFGHHTFVAVGYGGSIVQSSILAPVRPVLGPVVLLSTSAAQVTLNGEAGQTYSIQASTNPTDWLTITNLTLNNTSGQFVDPAASNYPRRFYRAAVQ